MIVRIVFKRIISDSEPNSYISKKIQLSFIPLEDMVIDDGTEDDLEFKKPQYCINGIPDNFPDDPSFLVDLNEIEEADVDEYLVKGWNRYIES